METENLKITDNEAIEEKIFVIRGKQVMLDSDVAYFFGTEVKKLNQQMKRNKERFPDDFCFQLNSLKFKALRSQNVTIDSKQGKRKYLPYVYTEHGFLSFLIIDDEECYFLGTSINYAGRKAFAVNKAEKEIVELLLAKF